MTPSANQKAFRGFKNVSGVPPLPVQQAQHIRLEDASAFGPGQKQDEMVKNHDMQTSAAQNRTTNHESGSNMLRTNALSNEYADS